jgi:hypothetical protein
MSRKLFPIVVVVALVGAGRNTQAQTVITFDSTITQPAGAEPPDNFLVELHYATAPNPAGSTTFFTQGFAFGGNTASPLLGANGNQPDLYVINHPELCPSILAVACTTNGSNTLATAAPFAVLRQGAGMMGIYSFDAFGLFPSGGCGTPCTGNNTVLPNATSLLVYGMRPGQPALQQQFAITTGIQTFTFTDPRWFNVRRVIFIPLDAVGNAYTSAVAIDNLKVQFAESVLTDFDGDRKSDIVVYRQSTGEWLIRNSASNYVVGSGNWYFQWGLSGDVPLRGDFDSDGRTDIAVYRPSTGEWFIRLSSQNYTVGAGNWYFQWGLPGDVPVPRDFDGDGRTDIAVYRPSTGEWFIRLSSQNYTVGAGNWYFQWGRTGDVPIPRDYDGDGKADIGVYRPSTGEWFALLSAQNYVVGAGNWYIQWGLAGDLPIPLDYDGDGKADVAVYRPTTGEWFLRLSSQNYAAGAGNWYFQWGLSGDLARPGDFDGDGKPDIAVYRPTTGEWFIRSSSLNYAVGAGNWYFQWGLTDDTALASN